MANTEQYTILHVYDNKNFDEDLCNELNESDYSVKSENNFNHLINAIDQNTKVIVISSIALTDSVTSFFKQIKQSKYNHIPILALVRTREHIYIKNILKLGYSDYISKDNTPNEIAKQIIDFIRKDAGNTNWISELSISIIDDDIMHSRLIQKALNKKGLICIKQYHSGEEFFKSPDKCDIYLVDIVLEEISGITVIRKIRKLYPNTFVLVISSLVEDKIITSALTSGADDFISKPINFEILFAKIIAHFKH